MNIAMLISGGVDSSVSLRILKEAGHTITAFYLKIWLEDEMSFLGECPWEEDIAFIEEVCRDAQVPLVVVPFQKEYWERIVSYTIDEVKAGRTPNPDVLCNTRVKFGAFYEYLLREGLPFDAIASGHYAQTAVIDGVKYLCKAVDEHKDQTYFLSQLTSDQVSRVLFPIGHLQKSEVRKLAEQFHLPNAQRKDSQGLCFLGKIRFDEFVKFHLGTKKGDIVDFETKQKIGWHEGFWYYTIGQRRGIKLSGGPWYVVAKDTAQNIVFISNSYRSELSARNAFEVSRISWTVPESVQSILCDKQNDAVLEKKLAQHFACEEHELRVKLRHGKASYACRIQWLDEKKLAVTLEGYDTGIAAGQFAVFSFGDYCLGSGVIE
jgi:tRNA-specific 2-thiouridylase